MSSTSEVTIGGLVGTRWKPALSVEMTDGVAIITFDLPNESVNKLSRAVKDEFVALVTRLERDTTVHAAVFISGKSDVWIAGADIEEFLQLKTATDAERLSRDGQMLLDSVERLRVPIIAAIHGACLGGGLETALACDIRIASDRAQFGSFEARRGYHHGDGGIVRLVNTCGAGIALEMLLTAEPIDAQRALQCNLVARVVEHDELMAEAEKTAQHILRNSQRAVRSAKETILDVIGRPLDEQLTIDAINGYTSADAEETLALLRRFYDKTDAGRAGEHETPLDPGS